MFTKSLVAALVVASAALALTANANARPDAKAQTSQETFYMERASQNHDNGGN